MFGSGYFAVDGSLPLETVLPQSFMCVYIAIFATIMHVDNAPSLKCNSYKQESWLVGHLEEDSVQWRGRAGT